MSRPDASEHAPYFERYIKLADGNDAVQALEAATGRLAGFLRSIPAEKADYRYGADKWTVKEFLQHLIDAERIFCYRALSIARGEKQPLLPFDENSYAATADLSHRELAAIADDMEIARASTLSLYRSLSAADLARTGTASGHPTTPNALAFIIAGHQVHHENIYAERYSQ